MEKIDELPQYSPVDQYARRHVSRRRKRNAVRVLILACLSYMLFSIWQRHESPPPQTILSLERLEEDYQTCTKLRKKPQDPSGQRERNARYVDGQKAILIRNATVWTGEPKSGTSLQDARNGTGYEWITSDILLQYGLIERVQAHIRDEDLPKDYLLYDAHGRQLTAGIIDMHSHTGVDSLPTLRGNDDVNELSTDITPYARSIDGLNPLDRQLQVIKSGGVTTSLILPGSGNNMGGEAFVIKHAVGKPDGRSELSIQDMLADPDKNWRYMKMACGENAKNVFGTVGRNFGPYSRLGEAWYFRHAFEEATKLKLAQDDWCAAADQVGAQNMQAYLPLDLKWETLSAALRGQVHVNTHCYTVPDLESFIGYTNEFKFPLRAFHHAHQTYLVPEVLKRVYGGRPPAAALFADNMNYKAESYIASEQAGKVLYEAGITPVYVSDNPVLNAQHVVFEAAKAYRYGLPYHVALAGVTSASAELLGLGERIGKVKAGFDADITVWDSDPLSVGATPVQVFIDGVPQFENPVELKKPATKPINPSEQIHLAEDDMQELPNAILTGVSSILLPHMEQTFALENPANVVISNGSIVCVGECKSEISTSNAPSIALRNGHVAPPATIFCSLLGLEEISAEDSTNDGGNSAASFSAAVDGLSFEGKNLAAAYARGVTKAVSAPSFLEGGLKGVSAGFRISAPHALAPHAVFAPHAAVHYTLMPSVKSERTPSISSAIAELRRKLYSAAAHLSSSLTARGSAKGKKDDDNEDLDEETHFLIHVLTADLPLVITVHSVDAIAALLRLKAELEDHLSSSSFSSSSSSSSPKPSLKLILHGAAESHLLAPQIAAANVSVVLAPLLAYSSSWDQRRSLSGAPRDPGTAIDALLAADVRVALGVVEDWEVRDLWLLAGIAKANSGGRIRDRDAVALLSGNVDAMLGLSSSSSSSSSSRGVGTMEEEGIREFVVFEGNPFEIDGQVRVIADGSGRVNAWM